MVRIEDAASLLSIYQLYQDNTYFFPLIAAVLTGQQDGSVFANSAKNPDVIYVEHSFGFARVFSKTDISPEDLELFTQFLHDRSRQSGGKIRLYWTLDYNFDLAGQPYCSQSYRQRFKLDEDRFRVRLRAHDGKIHDSADLDSNCISELEDSFGVVKRFWRNEADFKTHSLASYLTQDDKIVSVCYAAANVSRFAEIDVATHADFRARGLGAITACAFIEKCLEESIQPLWDCFTNNEPSIRLATTLGFVPYLEPYRFYTISPTELE